MEKKYTIYRVEHVSIKSTYDDAVHIGCYTKSFKGQGRMMSEHLDDDIWPGLRTDFPLYCTVNNSYDWYCAFDSIQRLHEWFGDWLNIMLEQEFVIREYVVSLMVTGRSHKQVFFDCKGIIAKKVVNHLELSN